MTARLLDGDAWVDDACAVLAAGGVVGLAFERLFGLAADAEHPAAVARVAAIKDRPGDRPGSKPISLILPELAALDRICPPLDPVARDLIARCWPGPLTLVLPARRGVLPAPLVGPTGFVGARLCGASPAAELARRCGRLLTATSANPAGGPDPLDHEPLLALDGVDVVVPGRVAGPPGSTVAIVEQGRVRVLRHGAVELAESAP